MATQLETLATLEWPVAAVRVKEGLSTDLLRKLAEQRNITSEELGAALHLTGRSLEGR